MPRRHKPAAWHAGSGAFATRLAKDVVDKARLLARIDVRR
jgi:hypothetical protein